MRIGMILDEPRGFPPDIRVEKEARALSEAGFEVGLLCVRVKRDQAERETCGGGLTVFRTPRPARPHGFARELPRKIRWMLHASLLREEWVPPILSFIQSFQPQVLHCHDLPIVQTVLAVARRPPYGGLPVVADLHENMPARRLAIISEAPLWQRLRFHLGFQYHTWRRAERRALRECAKILVVVPEGARRLTCDYAIPQDRIVLVSNTEDETTFQADRIDPEIVGRYRDHWVASYVGGIGPHRGIDVAIRAAGIAGPRISGFKLLVVGTREKDRRPFLEMAQAAKAAAYLELVEWVPSGQVSSYLAASRACLVPHSDTEHTQTTVPHKLFQYMMMARPVVVSDCAPLKRIVEETGAGLVFRADDAADLARRLIELAGSGTAGAAKYGENGRRAALGPYAWRHDGRRLVEMYRELEGMS